MGLGISEAPFKPDPSPITPSTVEKASQENTDDIQGAYNFAQRIEQRLWKYSASRNVVKRWLLELISWSLSAACMAGIVVMLFIYKNDPIPNWPLGLTLNAYISVLSKIASAALLLPISEALGQLKWSWFQGDNSKKMWDFEIFDNASRGPWGSLLLLVRTKGKSLAALGAAVTIFALALDPFFQQVVQYPEKWQKQDGAGSIPVATGYERVSPDQRYRDDFENLEYDQDMLAIANHYFYGSGMLPITFGKGIRSEVPLGCPYSNCTWSDYETLGICNKCTDVTENLEFGCKNGTLDWVQVPEVDVEKLETTYPNGTACGWYLKADDPLLMTGYNVDRDTAHDGEVLITRAQPLYDMFSRKAIPGYPAKLNYTRNPILHAIIASGGSLSDIHRNATPIAHECVLSWCAKTMTSTYSEGGYTENVTKTSHNDTVGASPWTSTKYFDDRGVYIGDDVWYQENITLKSGSGAVYQLSNVTHWLTASLFDDFFPSQYTLINSTDESDALLRYQQYLSDRVMRRNLTSNPYLHANISTHLDNLSTRLTNLMRSSSSSKKTEMRSGPAYDKETFVDVRWEWLALPLGLLALTFIFLVSTIIRSSLEQDYVGVWKTSAIATLLYGLPDEMQKKISKSKENGTPRAKAREVRVKWLPKAGWRLSGNTMSSLSPESTKPRRSSFSTQW